MLLSTFEQFELSREKISCVVTDHGSNFVKAFKEPGVQMRNDNDEEEGDDDFDLELMAQPLSVLPEHQSCTSHTLSLIATTDLENTNIVTPRG